MYITTFNYAPQVESAATILKNNIQELNDYHFANMDIHDAKYNTAYYNITNNNICKYMDTIKNSTSQLMFLSSKDCQAIGVGWGKEVFFLYIL
jgi:hypothetical protein